MDKSKNVSGKNLRKAKYLMYNRVISEEEKSMIILAYKMGKTSQFLKIIE